MKVLSRIQGSQLLHLFWIIGNGQSERKRRKGRDEVTLRVRSYQIY